MTSIYAGFIALANRLVKTKGAAMTHVKRTAAGYSPSLSAAAVTEASQSVYGVFNTSSGQRNKKPGSDTHVSQEILCSPQGFVVAPQPGDDMLWNGRRFTIIAADSVAPNGDVILWQLEVSSGS